MRLVIIILLIFDASIMQLKVKRNVKLFFSAVIIIEYNLPREQNYTVLMYLSQENMSFEP